jgi:hypothetical protein
VGKQHQLIIPEAVRALAAAELFPGETMKSGVLSESEFRTKKWELLSPRG